MKGNKVGLYYGLLLVLLVLISISTYYFNYFYNMMGIDNSLEKDMIKEQKQLSFNVKLFNDDFMKSSYEVESFDINSIDNINTYFNYNVTFTSNVEGEYSYYIIGNVLENEEKKEIFKSDIYKFEVNGSVINLSNSFNVDLDQLLDEYLKEGYSLDSNNDFVYDVVLTYSVYSEKLNKFMNDDDTITLRIPINSRTVINDLKEVETVKNEYSELNKEDNKIYSIICLEFAGAILIFILIFILIVKRINAQVFIYEETLKSYLKKYDSYIVKLEELPDLSKFNIKFVESIKDLVNVSKKQCIPINYFEVIKKHEATFIIIDNKKAYVYKLSSKNV